MSTGCSPACAIARRIAFAAPEPSSGPEVVVGVGGGAVSDDFGDRRRAAGQRMLEQFDDEDAGALAHHEPVASA